MYGNEYDDVHHSTCFPNTCGMRIMFCPKKLLSKNEGCMGGHLMFRWIWSTSPVHAPSGRLPSEARKGAPF